MYKYQHHVNYFLALTSMSLWHNVKKGLKYAALSYAIAYGGTLFAAGADYRFRHREALIDNPPPVAFDIRSFEFDDGRLLTIVGENHSYTRSESELAPRIAQRYGLIAHEGGGQNPFVFTLVSDIDLPAAFLYSRATDRGHRPTIHSSASWGSVVHLETNEDSYRAHMTTGQNMAVVALAFEGLLTAPFVYFQAKNDLEEERQGILDNEVPWLAAQATNLYERDEIMAHNLASLIEQRRARRILCVVGRWHVDGIIENLERRMTLTPTENPEF